MRYLEKREKGRDGEHKGVEGKEEGRRRKGDVDEEGIDTRGECGGNEGPRE